MYFFQKDLVESQTEDKVINTSTSKSSKPLLSKNIFLNQKLIRPYYDSSSALFTLIIKINKIRLCLLSTDHITNSIDHE